MKETKEIRENIDILNYWTKIVLQKCNQEQKQFDISVKDIPFEVGISH